MFSIDSRFVYFLVGKLTTETKKKKLTNCKLEIVNYIISSKFLFFSHTKTLKNNFLYTIILLFCSEVCLNSTNDCFLTYKKPSQYIEIFISLFNKYFLSLSFFCSMSKSILWLIISINITIIIYTNKSRYRYKYNN